MECEKRVKQYKKEIVVGNFVIVVFFLKFVLLVWVLVLLKVI